LFGLALFAGASLRAAAPFDYDTFLKAVRMPPEFTIELAAGDPLIRFPMFACFDDEGHLYVAESSGRDLYAGLKSLSRDCRVSRLEDANGDGRFEKTVVFQGRVTFPMGLAWRAGRLYLADPPELVALRDTDGDGRADRREVILSGFGHTDNGSLHGLTFGPDGLLYFTMGEPDGWKLPRGDGTFLEGVAGALFRCRPDGSRPEVISRGFENLVEVEFLPGGEIIGTDNWFQRPAGGYRDALVDCSPGGLYPYAADRGTPLPRTGILLPPVTLLPAVAHSGLTRLRLNGFPAAWRNSLFAAEHNTRKVVRHELRRQGSTFAASAEDFAASAHPDFHPSDVLEAADGSLLIVDTGGWYVEHCPTGRIRDSRAPGGIYRVRWKMAHNVKPWPEEARWAAIWRMNTDELRAQLADADSIAVGTAARALALQEDKSAGEALASLLESTNPPIRRAAAEALAVCGSRSHAPRLATALVKAGDDFEEHACVAALLALADEPFARNLLTHASPRARRAGLHLLDQPPFGTLRFRDLVAPLNDEDAGLRSAAMRLLERHRNWAADALPWLRSQLAAENRQTNAAALEALLIAFQSDAAVRKLISESIDSSGAAPESTRAFLFNVLPSLAAKPPEAEWLWAIPPALTNAILRAAALAAATAYPQAEFEPMLKRVAEDSSVPIAQRLVAVRASSRHPVLSEPVFAVALSSLEARAHAADRLVAVDLLARARLSPEQLRPLLRVLGRGGAVAPDALLPAFIRAARDETRPATSPSEVAL
jgi:glucose/arabinose dehydrogenase